MQTKFIQVTVAGHDFVIGDVPYVVHPDGQQVVDSAVTDQIQAMIAGEFARHGICSGATFKSMRKALRLKSIDVADLLGVTPETVSRWESGVLPMSRPAWIAVAALLRDTLEGRSEVRGVLEAAAKPRSLQAALTFPNAA